MYFVKGVTCAALSVNIKKKGELKGFDENILKSFVVIQPQHICFAFKMLQKTITTFYELKKILHEYPRALKKLVAVLRAFLNNLNKNYKMIF